MKKWFLNPAALLKSLGAFALCFVMLFTLTNALAEDPVGENGSQTKDAVTYTGSKLITDFCEVSFDPDLPTVSGGAGTMVPGTKYTIRMNPNETYPEKPQGALFDLEWMEYQLPVGSVDFRMVSPSGRVKMTDFDGDGNEIAIYGDISISESGLLKVTWDKTEPGYPYLAKTTNAQFYLELEMTVTDDGDLVVLPNQTEYHIDNTAKVTFTKQFTPDTIQSLVDENLSAYTFTTTLNRASKDATGDYVRNEDGHIVYTKETVSFALSQMTRTANGSYSITWDGLAPDGTKVVVTENEPQDAFLENKGYTLINTSMQAESGALTSRFSDSFSLDNVYQQDKGSLTIQKTIAEGSDVLASNLSDTQKGQIIFTVTGTALDGSTVMFGKNNNKTDKLTFTYAQMTNGAYRIDDLPAGTYTITETAKITDNEWTSVTYKVDNGAETTQTSADPISSLDSVTINNVGVNKGGNHTVSVENGYTRESGPLHLQKVYGDDSAELTKEQLQSVRYYITNSDNQVLWFDESSLNRFVGVSNSRNNPPEGVDPETAYCDIILYGRPGNAFDTFNLPVGTYTVHEVNLNFPGYTRETWYQSSKDGAWTKLDSSTQASFTMEVTKEDIGEDNVNSYVAFKNTYKENGQLKINKTVSGKNLTDNEKKAITFKVEYYNPETNKWETVAEKNLSNFSGNTLTLSGLPYGEYRVTETNATIANYTVTTQYQVTEYGANSTTQTTTDAENGTWATVNVRNPYAGNNGNSTVTDPLPGQVSFTNTYTEIKENLTISKSFSGSYPKDETLKMNVENSTYFTLKDDKGNTVRWKVVNGQNVYTTDTGDGVYSQIYYKDMANGSFTITGLPVGHTYTVTEEGAAVAGHTHNTSITVNGGSATTTTVASPSGAVQLTQNGGTGTIVFNNSYTPVAALKVTKKFAGDLGDAYCNANILDKLEFIVGVKDGSTVKYYDASGNLTTDESAAKKYTYKNISGGNSVSVLGDPDRVYVIKEVSADPNNNLSNLFDITVSSSVQGQQSVTGSELIEVSVDPGETVVAEFVNDYQEKYTPGIIPGENVAVVHHYKTWSGLDNGGCNGAEFAAVSKNVEFVLYQKDANGEWVEYAKYTLPELVGSTDAAPHIFLAVGTYKLEENNADLLGYQRLTTVLIKEANASLDNAIVKNQDITDAGVEFEVGSQQIIEISLANTYYPLADLKITKTLDVAGDLTTLNDFGENRESNITFTVKSSKDPAAAIKTFTLKDCSEVDGKWVYTIENLPVGEYKQNANDEWYLDYYTYTVEETGSIAGYNCTTTWTASGKDGVGNGTTGSVELIKVTSTSTATAEVEFTNKYTRQKGSLTVKKTFGTQGVNNPDTTFSIYDKNNNLIYWDANKAYAESGDSEFTYAEMTNGAFTITNLPTGEYTVKESGADVAGYRLNAAYTVKVGSGNAVNGTGTSTKVNVQSGTASEVHFTNTYTAIGQIKVHKTFSFVGNSTMTEENMKKVTFTLYKLDASEPDKKEFVKSVNGAQCTFTPNYEDGTHSFTYTFTDLELGTYSLEETNMDHNGYSRVTAVTIDGKTVNDVTAGSVELENPGQQREVYISNKYTEVGDLTIEKIFQGIDADFLKILNENKDKIVFAVLSGDTILPDNDGSKVVVEGQTIGTITYAQMTAQGDGCRYTLKNLPAGEYTVKEIILGEDNDVEAVDSLFYGYVHTNTEIWHTVKDNGNGYWQNVSSSAASVSEVSKSGVQVSSANAHFTYKNVYEKVTPLTAEKECEKYPLSDDNKLPTWEFIIKISNAYEQNVIDGEITIKDVFDVLHPECFVLVTEGDNAPSVTNAQSVTYNTDTPGQATYTIKLNENHNRDSQITLVYHLQVKDENRLIQLLQEEKNKTVIPPATGSKQETLEWTFKNTIEYNPMPNQTATDGATYAYSLAPIEKSLAKLPGSNRVRFTLNVNPEGVQVGTAQTLTILDNMTDNVEVDMASFDVTPREYRLQVIPELLDDGEWDLQITVPNGVALTITYEAKLKGEGNVKVVNTAKLLGATATDDDELEIDSDSTGSFAIARLYLQKYGASVLDPLAGAKFQLYDLGKDGNEAEPSLAAAYESSQSGVVVVEELNKAVTDEGGKTPTLEFDRWYKLVEIQAPRGFQLMNEEIRFYIPEKREPSGEGEYLRNSKIFVQNHPLETTAVLQAQKVLYGRELVEKNGEGEFVFELYDGNGKLLQSKKNAGNGQITFDAINFSYNDLAVVDETTGDVLRYEESITRTYTIKEIANNIAGITYDGTVYDVTITVKLNENATALVAEITYTNANGEVEIPTFTNYYNAEGQYQLTGTKTVQGATIIRDAFDFLIKYGEDELCTVSTPVYINGNEVDIPYPTFKFELISSGEESVTYNETDNIVLIKLKRESLGIGHKYVFTIDEVENANKPYGYSTSEFELELSAVDNGDGTLKVTAKLTQDGIYWPSAANFSNTYLGSLIIQKNVTVGGQATNSTLADGTYTFGVYQHNNSGLQPNKTVEITVKNGVSNTAVVTGLHGDWTWYIRELSSTNPDVSLVYGVKEVYVPGDKLKEIPTVPFTNNLGIGSLSLTKTVKGLGEYYSDDHKDKEFQFTVTIEDAANKTYTTTGTSAESVQFNVDGRATVTLKAGETITIEGLPIGAAYSIEEEKKLPAGYTAGTITNGTGVIVGGVTEAEQVNTYSAKGEAQLSVTKQVTGNEFTDSATEFTFVLKDEQGNIIETKSGPNEKAVVFKKIEYTKPGTYEYTIAETAGNVAGMTYDNAAHKVVVTVTDNGDGTLTAEAKYGENGADSLTITNTYQKVTFQPKVTKALSGNNVPTETYTFKLLDGENVVDTVTVTGAGEASFKAITKYAAGTYTYTIKEVAGTTPGMTYDSAAHTVTVKVSADNNGALSADIKYDADKTALTITNTYNKPVGNATISVTKAMSGDPYNGNEQFTFTLTPADTQSATNNKVTGDLSQAIAVGGAASWTVNYDKTGTYTYTIQETKGSTEGVIYDDTAYTVKVVVAYNQAKTALVSTVSYGANEAKELTVTNKYGETSYQPEVKKVLTGNTSLAPDETFFFTLTGAGIQPLTAQCEAGGTAEFGAITYKAPGTYTYAITETAGETEGMTYSDAEITLTVVVEQADNGKLSVTSATYTGGDGEGDTFTNTYREVTYQPEVKKLVTGTGAPEDATFTFQLKEGGKLVGTEKTIKAKETATFDKIVKHEAGVYIYTITEVKGTVPGMAYDTAAHTVTVTVSEDDNGALSAVIKYDESKDALEVTNVYTTVKYQPKAVKALTGDTDKALEETFSFTLTQTKAPEGVADYTETKTLAGTGEVAFSEITFALPGTYVFEITEKPGTTEGMIYSQEKVVVTVNVTADADNQLSLTADYKGGTGADYNTITNRYGETKNQLTMKKVLTGDTDRYLENETFTFQLLDSKREVLQTKACKAGESIIFDAITYKTVGTYTYTVVEVTPDTLTPGMTYSDEVIEYTVVVFADDKGKLSAVPSPKVGNVISNVITNVYDRPEGEATIEASKLISGNAYTGDEEFIFTLAQKNEATATNNVITGALSQEVAQNGSASWTVAYDTVGTYTYTIKETKGDTTGMVYDEAEHTVTVKVEYDEEDNNASLKTTVTYDGEKTNLDITNKFSEISFQPKVIKALVDLAKNAQEEVFTFGLTQLKPDGVEYTDEAYALIARAQDDESTLLTKEAAFATLTYNEPGTYVYEIMELAPEEGKGTPGMTYSEEIITYTVVVEKDEVTGGLTITSETYEGGTNNDNTITNEYVTPKGKAEIVVTKAITGNPYGEDKANQFTFTLTKMEGVMLSAMDDELTWDGFPLTVVNNSIAEDMVQTVGVGEVAKWTVVYDLPGTYYYTIVESDPQEAGVEYDPATYYVTVVAKYDEEMDQLSTTVTYGTEPDGTDEELTITNKYSEITFQPEIKKTLTGRFLLKEEFSFLLTQVATDDVAVSDPVYTDELSILIDPESTAYEIEASETGKFNALVYHEPGTYQYQIIEVIPEAKDRTPGMTYSKDVITYTVVVVKDEVTGALSIQSETYTTTPAEEGAEAYEGNTFTNAYARPEGEAEIFVNKAMIGNIYNGENEFTFELAKYDPNMSPDEEDKTDDETGTGGDLVAGDTVPSVKPGDLTEENGAGDNTGDGTDNGTEGEPEVPTVPAIKPPVKPGIGEMEPLVPMETNNLIFPGELQTIGVDKTAKWTIKYDQPGTYEYTLREIKGDEAGVTYDETIYRVTVVMDYLEDENGDRMSLIPVTITYADAEGNVIVAEKYTDPDEGEEDAETDPEGDNGEGGTTEGGEGESTEPGEDGGDEGTDPGEGEEPEAVKRGLTITNKYSGVSFVPEISKVVNGRGAPSEYFTFQLTETTEGREYWDTARCLADETAVFDEIVYHEPGVYTYTITELTPEYKTSGMTYSKEVVKLTVRVEDLGDGTGALTIETEYSQDTITNRYNPPSYYNYKFSFTKKWQGGVESTLEWTLYDADGNVVHKKFNKDVIDETEWYYEAWFAMDKGYYIIEDVPEGYEPIYVNVGQYADVTDRLYNGGTIINYKAPQTGDANNPFAWAALMLCSAAAMLVVVLRRRRAH